MRRTAGFAPHSQIDCRPICTISWIRSRLSDEDRARHRAICGKYQDQSQRQKLDQHEGMIPC